MLYLPKINVRIYFFLKVYNTQYILFDTPQIPRGILLLSDNKPLLVLNLKLFFLAHTFGSWVIREYRSPWGGGGGDSLVAIFKMCSIF